MKKQELEKFFDHFNHKFCLNFDEFRNKSLGEYLKLRGKNFKTGFHIGRGDILDLIEDMKNEFMGKKVSCFEDGWLLDEIVKFEQKKALELVEILSGKSTEMEIEVCVNIFEERESNEEVFEIGKIFEESLNGTLFSLKMFHFFVCDYINRQKCLIKAHKKKRGCNCECE